MPSSWSESNRLHSSNMREDAAEDALMEFEDSRELTAEDFEEMRLLARLDAIHDGDFDADFDGSFDYHDSFNEPEDRYLDALYEGRTDIDLPDFF